MSRIENLTQIITNLSADALLITHGDNRLYASGFISSAGMVFVTKDADALYLTDSRYLEAAEKELDEGFGIADITTGFVPVVNELIRKYGVKRLVVEDLHLTIAEYKNMQENLNAELVFAGNKVDKLRAYLTVEDKEALKYAQSLAEKSLFEAINNFRIGMTEKEIEAELVYRMYMNGADDLAFKPEIISGANASMPHGNPSDKPIVEGDILLMDFGLIKNGYWSDMTRCFAIGYASDEVSRVYYKVLEAQKTAIEKFKLGMVAKDVDAVARNIIMSSGLEGCYQHGLGHAIGLLGAAPSLLTNRFSTDIIEPGNCLTFEPGIYQPGKLGCRIEDIVWIGEDGVKENLTHFPKDELIVLK